MINKETQLKIVKSYLGRFACPVSVQERGKFLAFMSEDIKAYYLKGSETEAHKFISVFLLSKGRVTYRYRTTYDTVQMFLDKNEETNDFMDLFTPLLIIEHCKNTVENRQLEPLNKQLIHQRKQAGLTTIFMASAPATTIEPLCKTITLSGSVSAPDLI